MIKNLHVLKAIGIACWLAIMFMPSAYGQNWELIQPKYATTDAVVATFSVDDFGATGDGSSDVTSIFQGRLNALASLGGGVLFVPEGKYVIRGTLIIPKGITLRGEWRKPVKGQPVVGTILMAYSGRGNEAATPFIMMEPSAAVMDVAIWYPEQDPNNITAYPPAVQFGRPNYFGNEFCNAKNVTLVNAYTGIVFSRENGGTCPTINGVYGTPLSRGVEIDNIVDVGRVEWVDFSPAYWAGSGLPGSPQAGGAYATWINKNGTGIVMRRNDWSYTCHATVEGYRIGFHAGISVASAGATPNGHNFNFNFTNCRNGIYIDGGNSVGNMFTRMNFTNCDTAVNIAANTSGVVQFYKCTIDAKTALYTAATTTTKIALQESVINKGPVTLYGGTLVASDCDFNTAAPQARIEANARAILTGNRFKNTKQIIENSVFKNSVDDTALDLKPLPDFPILTPAVKKPARSALYIVTQAPFNAVANGTTDNTTAIQAALNKAAADGGGIVFLPPGKYKVSGNLTVPAGVELKGSVDVSTTPTGPGSVLEVYEGRGNPSASPFLKLAAGSGLRGVVFNYPEQRIADMPAVQAYPYCIQVQGSNVYIVNVGIRAAYRGIDLFTYKCDNHYVDFVAGHVFKTGLQVGGGSSDGLIQNLQFNVIAYACGAESKFGSWPNSAPGCSNLPYDYGFANLDFMVLADCSNETLYNNFNYCSNRGVIFTSANGSGPSGSCLGLGIDGARNALIYESLGSGGFDLINSQVVAFGDGDTKYIQTSPGFNSEVTLFNSDYWGNPSNGVVMNGGSINLQSANFQAPGQQALGNISDGSLNLSNSIVSPVNPLLNAGAESHVGLQGSVVDPSGINTNNLAEWFNNQGSGPIASLERAIDRTGWIATASANNNNAKNAIDGNNATRWDTQGSQVSGQWFTIDMRTAHTFNEIILDVSGSPSDSPNGYGLYVSNDGVNWGSPIASGQGTDGMTVITFPAVSARYFRIVQTGSKGNYWSIHELYVFNVSESVTRSPYTGTPHAIPGKIEAEEYDLGGEGIAFHDDAARSGDTSFRTDDSVDSEVASEGTYDVGYIAAGEWLEYSVNVNQAGPYFIDIRVASPYSGKSLHIDLDGQNISGAVAIPNTTDWQTYQTVSITTPVLTTGAHTLRITMDTDGFNLNYVTFRYNASGSTPFANATIPGTIEAENYDNGGEGVAYHDNETQNNFAQFRLPEGVDVEACSEGGYDVGFIAANEWLNYTVQIMASGVYDLSIRTATPNSGRKLHVEVDGANISGTVNIPNTGNWQVYSTTKVVTPQLQAGWHVVKVVMENNDFNLNYLKFDTHLSANAQAKIQSDRESESVLVSVYPNPVDGASVWVTVQGKDDEAYTAQLINAKQEPVGNITFTAAPGNRGYELTLPQGLPAGLYLLILNASNGNRYIRKIIVK